MSPMTDPFDERVRRALRRRAARIDPPGDALADIHHRARRQRRARRTAVSLAVIAVLGLGAAAALPLATRPDVVLGPGSEPSTPAASPERPAADDGDAPPAGTSTCEGSDHGVTFRIHYPDTWWASDGNPAEPCHWFHPEPYDMPTEARDVPGVAIHVEVIDTPFDELRRLDPEREELLSESETTVDGRPAVVQEYVSHIETLYPSGTRFSRFLVQVDGRTLLGTAAEASAADYADSTTALDQIAADLEVLRVSAPSERGPEGQCSAEGHPFPPEPQEGLPLSVAETRAAIVEAAVACDVGRLVELAGEEFTFSFGGGDDFAGFLLRGEERAPRPLRYLVELLDRPYETVEVQGQTQYVWPSAFAYDDWAEVPEADREALQPLYDEEDFTRFARFGGYTGYRVGISADGDWLFFVAGD